MAVLLLFNLRAHLEIAHLHGYIHKKNVIVTGVILSSILVITGFYFIHDKQAHNYLLSSIVFLLVLVLFIHLVKRRYKYMAAILPMIIVALSLSCLWQINSMNNGYLLIIFLYLVTETNDAFALIFGKLIGRKKLCPAISPNKTWEGMLAGVVIAMTAGLAYNHYILNYKFLDSSLIIGLIIASAILGDLAFSAYKRVYKTKDFMALIKGHGGIIDIYDSLLISSIAFYLLIQLIGSSRFS